MGGGLWVVGGGRFSLSTHKQSRVSEGALKRNNGCPRTQESLSTGGPTTTTKRQKRGPSRSVRSAALLAIWGPSPNHTCMAGCVLKPRGISCWDAHIRCECHVFFHDLRHWIVGNLRGTAPSRRPTSTSRLPDCRRRGHAGRATRAGPRRPSFTRRLCGRLCEFGFCRGPVFCNPRRPNFTNTNRFCDCCKLCEFGFVVALYFAKSGGGA